MISKNEKTKEERNATNEWKTYSSNVWKCVLDTSRIYACLMSITNRLLILYYDHNIQTNFRLCQFSICPVSTLK